MFKRTHSSSRLWKISKRLDYRGGSSRYFEDETKERIIVLFRNASFVAVTYNKAKKCCNFDCGKVNRAIFSVDGISDCENVDDKVITDKIEEYLTAIKNLSL